jgi:hypothetical protein
MTLLHVLPVATAANPDAMKWAEALHKEMQKMFYSQIDLRSPIELVIDFGDAAERILAHAETVSVGSHRPGSG